MVVNGLSGNREVEFVQGDTYEYRLTFADESVGGAVQRVVLTSEKFGVQKEFEKDVADGSWFCRFESEETAGMCAGSGTYDVTAWIDSGGEELIVASESGVKFEVKKKKNPVVDNGVGGE